jgi:PAS domain S-box-containing protein
VPHPSAAAPEPEEGPRSAASETRPGAAEAILSICSVLEYVAGYVLAIGPEGHAAHVSDGWTGPSGDGASDAAGRPWTELLAPGGREAAESVRLRALSAPGSPECADVAVVDPAGGIRILEVVASAPADSHLTGWVLLTGRDVTEQRRQERELRDRAERYQQMFEEDITGNYCATIDGTLLECNSAFLEILGFASRAEAEATNMVELYPDPAERTRLLSRLASAGQIKHLELVLRRRDGRMVHIVENVVASFDGSGGLAEIRANLFDITQQARLSQERAEALQRETAARALAEAAERRAAFLADLSTLLDSSLEYRTTLDNMARRLVPALADYCLIDEATDEGGSRRVAVAHVDPDYELHLSRDVENAPDADPSLHPVLQVLRTGVPRLVSDTSTEQLRAIAHDPEHLQKLQEMRIRGYIIVPLIARGRVLGALTLVSSISQRRFTQQDVDLAAEVAGRGALAIDNARLYGRAQQALRARDEVLAFVSHDLRNPLATILLNASALLDMVPTDWLLPGQREQLEWIAHSSEQMNRLIQDLMDISRMETGRLPMELSAVDPANLLWEAGILLHPVAAERGVRLEIETNGDGTVAWLDRERILRVLWNLVGNAIKFTPPGGAVRVSTRMVDREIRFAVQDTGMGIAPEHHSRVFERYWHRGSPGGGTGSGLGLTIARGIVDAHGGRIWFDSKVHEGTTFFFTLPVERRGNGGG